MSALNPTEVDRLQVFLAAELARRTRSLGLKLNAPEAAALIADEMHLAARAGMSYAEVRAAGLRAVSADQVLDGVPEIVPEVRVEVLLEEGTRLIALRAPIRPAAYGSGGVPAAPTSEANAEGAPPAERPPVAGERIGAVRLAEGEVELSAGRARIRLRVENRSQRTVRISSHWPFWRANWRLAFDREAARGYRLDIPAGSHVRWAPGEVREVELVRLGGTGGEE
jgi:urease subunit gamma/beta